MGVLNTLDGVEGRERSAAVDVSPSPSPREEYAIREICGDLRFGDEKIGGVPKEESGLVPP